MRLILRVLGRLRSSGEDNVPRRGGVLYCPNHISDADPTAIFVTAPRRCWMVGKRELFEIPFLGPLLRPAAGDPDSAGQPGPGRPAADRGGPERRRGRFCCSPKAACPRTAACSHFSLASPWSPCGRERRSSPSAWKTQTASCPMARLSRAGPLTPVIVTYGPPIHPAGLRASAARQGHRRHHAEV